MSRNFTFVVIYPSRRRETIKVSQNTSLLQVLEEACLKQKLNSEDYELRHYNKPLDLSLPIRFSNLQNNALLELYPATNSRKDCLVTVALQFESGERFTGNFSPSTCVFDVIAECTRSNPIAEKEMEELVCIYMRQKIAGDAIRSTTLRSLGLTSGQAIIRLMFRKPEELDGQAHVSSPLIAAPSVAKMEVESEPSDVPLAIKSNEQLQCSAPEEEIQSTKIKPKVDLKENEENSLTSGRDCNENSMTESQINAKRVRLREYYSSFYDNEKRNENSTESLDQTESMDCESVVQDTCTDIGEIKYIGERHSVIYSLDDITNEKKADLPDEFFDLTIRDAQYLMQQYTRERIELENQPLLTKQQRERQFLQKLANYSQTVIRVYFPERLVLQAVFSAVETVQTVSDFIQSFLSDKTLNFYLYITPPKEKLNPTKTLLECMLVPAAVVHFGCDVQLPRYLIENLRESLSDPRAAALAASTSRKTIVSNVDMDEPCQSINNTAVQNKVENVTSVTSNLQTPINVTSQDKVPKWLKLSKK